MGTLVERTSGYLILFKMSDATATSVVEGFSAALNLIPLSMAYDQCVAPLSLAGRGNLIF